MICEVFVPWNVTGHEESVAPREWLGVGARFTDFPESTKGAAEWDRIVET